MSLLLASIGFGLVSAAVLALAAVGFTLQFAVADVLNLAYGAVMMWSARSEAAISRPRFRRTPPGQGRHAGRGRSRFPRI